MTPTATMEKTHATDALVLLPCVCARRGSNPSPNGVCQVCTGKQLVWCLRATRPRLR